MHATVPVRFGRGRLDSLGHKGLAAYLIARALGLRAEVDLTEERYNRAFSLAGQRRNHLDGPVILFQGYTPLLGRTT